MATAALATLIAAGALTLKARRASGARVWGRKFLLSFLPPVGAAVALTAALYAHGAVALLPGLWLLSYGAAVVTASRTCSTSPPAT